MTTRWVKERLAELPLETLCARLRGHYDGVKYQESPLQQEAARRLEVLYEAVKHLPEVSGRRLMAVAKAGYETLQQALERELGHKIGLTPAQSWDNADSTLHAIWLEVAEAVLKATQNP